MLWESWDVSTNHKQPVTEPEGFYVQALSQAERVRLSKAHEMEGLDEEIALLRVRLLRLAEEHPEKLELLYKGVDLLIKAVAARYRLSKKSEDDLYQNVLGVLRGIGDTLWPEEHRGA